MKTRKIILYSLVVAAGVFVFIFGGYDDSPGAQLLGAVVFAVGVRGIIKTARQKKSVVGAP